MSKIHINMGYPGSPTTGPRVSHWEEPTVTEPKSKTKSRLKNKRKRPESVSPAKLTVGPGEVKVTLSNWKGRFPWHQGK